MKKISNLITADKSEREAFLITISRLIIVARWQF